MIYKEIDSERGIVKNKEYLAIKEDFMPTIDAFVKALPENFSTDTMTQRQVSGFVATDEVQEIIERHAARLAAPAARSQGPLNKGPAG